MKPYFSAKSPVTTTRLAFSKQKKRRGRRTKSRFSIEPLEFRTMMTALAGVIDSPGFSAEISPLVPSGSARLQFDSLTAVTVSAFVDFNADGGFDQSELVTPAGGYQASAGISAVEFDIPPNAAVQEVATKIEWTVSGGVGGVGTAASNLGVVVIQSSPNGDVGQEVVVDRQYASQVGSSAAGGVIGFNRFSTLQQALNVVAEGGEVSIAAGVYPESITIDRDVTLTGIASESATTVIQATGGSHGIDVENSANVVIQNLSILGGVDGIHVTSAGDVSINNVHVTGSANNGLSVVDSGNLQLSNSSFAASDADGDGEGRGIFLTQVGNVSLSTVRSEGNIAGVHVSHAQSFNDLNGVYSDNLQHGLYLTDVVGDVVLSGTRLQDNDHDLDNRGDGLVIESMFLDRAVGGDVVLSGISVGAPNHNTQRDGITIESVGGDVVFRNSSIVTGNSSDGVTVGIVDGAVKISDSTFTSAKGLDGQGSNFFVLSAHDVDVNNSTFSDAGFKDGLQIETVTGSLTVSQSTFDGNNRYGLRVDRSNVVALTNNSFANNGSDGIRLSNNFGGVKLNNIDASGNGGDGLRLIRSGDLVLNGGEFSGLFVRNANSVAFNSNSFDGKQLVESTDRIDIVSHNGIALDTNLDAANATVRLVANSDGAGSEGFVMASGTMLRTSNESGGAVSITVNTILGGDGPADLQEIVTGTHTGTVGIFTTGGAVIDGNAGANNLAAARALIHAMGSVGAKGQALDGLVSRLEGAGNGFYFRNNQPLTIGGVDSGFTGIASPDLSVDVRSVGAMTVSENVIGAQHVFLKALESNAAGDDLRVNRHIRVESKSEDVELHAGDNITLTETATIAAAGSIFLKSDCADNDPAAGTIITVASEIISTHGTRIEGGSDDDVYDIRYPADSQFIGGMTVVDRAGTDTVIVSGTMGDDLIFVTPTNDDQVVGRQAEDAEAIFVPHVIETLQVNTFEGLDTVHMAPTTTTVVDLDGGSPNFGDQQVPPGDTLVFDPAGSVFSMVNSTLRINDLPDIAFSHFETIELANASPGAAQRFDFNTTLSFSSGVDLTPTQEGYQSVARDTFFSPGGFGWDEPVGSTFTPDQAGPLSDLLNDAHVYIPPSGAQTRTFTATVENGLVLVTVVYGTHTDSVTEFQIENGDTDEIIVSGLGAYRRNWGHESFFVEVTDGTLDLRFRAPFGNNRLIALNGLTIEPARLLGMGIVPPSNSLPADGTTVDEFTFSGPANSLITVESSLGSVVSPDADSFLLGRQIRTDENGQAVLQVRRSVVEGTSSLTFSMPTGEFLSGAEIDYAILNSRNFDFNTPTSATFSPFNPESNPNGFVAVHPDSVYSKDTGFGWTSTNINAFRLSPTIGGDRADLLDDGHRASDLRTFRTDLSNGQYQVSVIAGSDTDHESVSIDANGRSVLNSQQIRRRNHFQTVFDVNVTSGVLDLTFSQNAGAFQDPHWIVNAISILPSTLVSTFDPVGIAGSVPADGSTLSQLEFETGAANGSLVTVDISAGTIVSADADTVLAGVQVPVKNGRVVFEVQSPASPSTPVVELNTLSGDHHSAIEDKDFLDFLDTFFSNSVEPTVPFE